MTAVAPAPPELSTVHLAPAAAKTLELPDQQRIDWINVLGWIDTEPAIQVLSRCEELKRHPQVGRMPGLLVVGPSNAGKTRIMERFLELNPRVETDEGALCPVLMVQAPPEPVESRLYAAIVREMCDVLRRAQRVAELEFQALTLLRNTKVRVLIIDEVQHVIAGTRMRQRHFLHTLKYIANQLRIVLVLVGTLPAFDAINTDEQLANRFDRIVLRDWAPDGKFQKLLRTLEKMLPLKYPSLLGDRAQADIIFSKTHGRLGEVCGYLKRCAIYAIKTKKEFIDPQLLDEVPFVPMRDRDDRDKY